MTNTKIVNVDKLIAKAIKKYPSLKDILDLEVEKLFIVIECVSGSPSFLDDILDPDSFMCYEDLPFNIIFGELLGESVDDDILEVKVTVMFKNKDIYHLRIRNGEVVYLLK